ncbi:hypothetical protein RDWZM_010522 [Blomia tropicalis]|uniref:Mpv17-like protein 2 n=1 Tax=Blomia tropicalis TaxID=40697 RepID=A0A9Q0LZC5_BLOTA|nr:hypothetical protein RDWZM_010522 [Blomia tropicalis]
MWTTANTIRAHSRRVTTFIHSVVFGRHVLITNALISASMGAVGDSIQQNYDLLMASFRNKSIDQPKMLKNYKDDDDTDKLEKYSFTRTIHMTMAGLTTGMVTHYWYIWLDRYLGVKRTPIVLAKKILADQILFSPVNLFVYFTTLGICERSKWSHICDELKEKGFENIYIAEWLIWPPMQLINFALLPLRYRILFDNIVSLGFDVYSPYVKYKTELRSEKIGKNTDSNEI